MTKTEAMKRARELTMACWWPSVINGHRPVNMPGVIGELVGRREQSLFYEHLDDAAEVTEVLKALGP